MTHVSRCVVCDGEIRRLRRASVAPFLAQRIWNRPAFRVDLVQCSQCGFIFYNPRLDASEEARLYIGYRSAEYQQMRQASEPWYTPTFNADLASRSHYELRRRTLSAILREHVVQRLGRQVRRVLDYGGDHGDLVCGLLDGASAFVYDISGAAAVDGVAATTDPAACQADLIINSNVLEHVGFPRRVLGEIVQATPPGGLIYLEVPCESALGLARIVRRVAQIGIMALTHPALIPSIARPSSLYMMHEHVNYFSEESLATLMRSCGCHVIATGKCAVDARSGKGFMAWCLGSPGK